MRVPSDRTDDRIGRASKENPCVDVIGRRRILEDAAEGHVVSADISEGDGARSATDPGSARRAVRVQIDDIAACRRCIAQERCGIDRGSRKACCADRAGSGDIQRSGDRVAPHRQIAAERFSCRRDRAACQRVGADVDRASAGDGSDRQRAERCAARDRQGSGSDRGCKGGNLGLQIRDIGRGRNSDHVGERVEDVVVHVVERERVDGSAREKELS